MSVVLHHSFQSLAQPTSSQTPEFITNADRNAVALLPTAIINLEQGCVSRSTASRDVSARARTAKLASRVPGP